jgi:dipeptidyl aminopeptidase/acylaminoacyl peptidase
MGVWMEMCRVVLRRAGTRSGAIRATIGLFFIGCLSAANAAPVETYGRLPVLEDVVLSPDASKLAFVRTLDDARLLAIVSLADGKVIVGAKLGELKLRELRWADSDHLLITTSRTGMPFGLIGTDTEWELLSVFELSSHKLRTYPEPQEGVDTVNVLAGNLMVRHVGNDTVLFIPGLWVQDQTMPALFKVNLTTHHQSIVRQGSEVTRGWLVDDAGEIVAEDSYYERDQRWQMRLRHDGHWLDAESTHAPIDIPHMLGFGPKSDAILISTKESGRWVWELMSLQDGKFGGPLEEGGSLSAVIEDPATHRMIGGIRVEDESTYVFFDNELRSRWRSVTDAFEGERVELASVSADMMQFVVRVDGPVHGYSYQLVNMNTARTTPIGDVYAGIKQANETRRITYEAADGLKIPAYLTLPLGKPATKLPLIVMPHGGPATRDTADFDWWAQALAAQGYAVLKPNYRGSTLGDSFLEAGFGQWGKKMQTDLSDGVRYLAKEGIIDPARVCIVGASYGGYAALAGVTLDPGVYRCAVSVSGISDVKRFLEWVHERDAIGDHTAQRYWDRFMGVSSYKDPAIDTISPIKHLDRVGVPVLLVHGRDDTVVPFEQSDIMLSAMKKADKNVELVVLKKEDHWLSRSQTRLQMLQSTVAFLKAHNPPD